MSFMTLVNRLTNAATPATDRVRLFSKANMLFSVDDVGTVTQLSGGIRRVPVTDIDDPSTELNVLDGVAAGDLIIATESRIGADDLHSIYAFDPTPASEPENVPITVDGASGGRWLSLTGSTAFAQLSSSVDQIPTSTNPAIITYDTQDGILGITHSLVSNTGVITIRTPGTYLIIAQPQVGKDSGASKLELDMFMQVDRGPGFADETNSNVKYGLKDSELTDVLVAALVLRLQIGESFRFMQRVSATGSGLGLKASASEVGPPSIPATPSVILAVARLGRL